MNASRTERGRSLVCAALGALLAGPVATGTFWAVGRLRWGPEEQLEGVLGMILNGLLLIGAVGGAFIGWRANKAITTDDLVYPTLLPIIVATLISVFSGQLGANLQHLGGSAALGALAAAWATWQVARRWATPKDRIRLTG